MISGQKIQVTVSFAPLLAALGGNPFVGQRFKMSNRFATVNVK
jgi:hypothetical protein